MTTQGACPLPFVSFVLKDLQEGGPTTWCRFWKDDWAEAWVDCPKPEWLLLMAGCAGVDLRTLLRATVLLAARWAPAGRPAEYAALLDRLDRLHEGSDDEIQNEVVAALGRIPLGARRLPESGLAVDPRDLDRQSRVLRGLVLAVFLGVDSLRKGQRRNLVVLQKLAELVGRLATAAALGLPREGRVGEQELCAAIRADWLPLPVVLEALVGEGASGR